MRKLVLLAAVAATTIVSGCIVVPGGRGYRYYDSAPQGGGQRYYRGDRDGDGVPNRYDARPGNPYRY